MTLSSHHSRRIAAVAAAAAAAFVVGLTGPSTIATAGTAPTLFGTSVYTGDGTTFAQALERQRTKLGKLQVVRVYLRTPQPWPGKTGMPGTPVVVSFQLPAKEIIAGKHDAAFTQWFRAAPRDRKVYWSYFHEPEDNITKGEMTSADYRAAFRRLDGLAAKASNPNLLTTTIHMTWSLDPRSGWNWNDLYPGDAYVDVLGFDLYDRADRNGYYKSPSVLLERVVKLAKSKNKPWGIAELGTNMAAGDTGTGRAAWLRGVGTHARSNNAAFVSYWDAVGGPWADKEFRLLDSPSIKAWRDTIASSATSTSTTTTLTQVSGRPGPL